MTIKRKKLFYIVLYTLFVAEGVFSMGIFTQYHLGHFDPPSIPVFFSAPQSRSLFSGIPKELHIPAIDVNARIQSVGLNPDGSGEMGVPSNFLDVAWYNQGSRPGMDGNAVIDGHRSGKYIPNAVFHRLHELKPHDLVEVVDDEGSHLQFEVVEVKTYEHDAPAEEVFVSNNGRPRLNLITCAGDWIEDAKIFDERIVVFTELLGVKEKKEVAEEVVI